LLIGILVALLVAFPGFSVGQLVQLLGISGLALGIAFRDLFADFVAGILLLIEEPFRIGDQIVLEEFEGTIETIETRATSIRTYDGRRVIIPNTDLFTDRVIVNTAYACRRIEYDVGIGYGDDADRAKALVFRALEQIEGVLQVPPPEVLVMELADFSVILRVRWWIEPPRRADAMDSRDRVLAAVKQTLIANGIDLPFPTHQVLFHDQTEETDGDRARQREGWPAGQGAVPRVQRTSDVLLGLVDDLLER
jgi:small-conductance mechanosensitive channel